MNKAKTVSLKKNFIFSTFYEILCVILPFITTPYIARVLEPYGVGVYDYTESIKYYFSLFAALGTASYGKREIARSRDNIEECSQTFWEIELLSVFTSVITLLCWGVFIFFANQYKLIYIIFTISLLSTMLNINWFYAGLEQFQYTVFRNSLVKIVGLAGLFLFVKTKNDLVIYVFINCIIDFIGNLSMWFPLKSFLVKVNFKSLNIFKHFKGTLVFFIPAISTSLYTVLDRILIGAITKEPVYNGYYKQANNIIKFAKTFSFMSLNSLLESRMSYLFKIQDYKEIKTKINQSLNYIFFMSIGLFFGIFATANDFMPLFLGKGYEQVPAILKCMAPTIIIIGISNCIGSHYYNPAGLRAKSALFLIIGAVINLILTVLLIPKYNVYGAVAGSVLAETVITILYVIFSNGYFPLKLLIKTSYKKFIAGILMFVYILIVSKYTFNIYLKLSVEVIIGIIIYIAILLLLKDESIGIIMKKLKKSKK